MTSEKLYSKIIRLGLPILVGQLGMIVVGFADNIMVGHYSTEALASASFVNNVFNVVMLACMGFSFGLTPLIGALFSQGEHKRIGELLRSGLAINLIYGLLLALAMCILYFFLDKLGQPAQLLPLIRPYYLIFLAGVLPVVVFNVMSQWSYAITNSAMPMWIVLASNAVNILGNWLLIYGNLGCPELGLTGAGIATLISRVICPVAILWIFFKSPRYRDYANGFRNGHIKAASMRQVCKTSLPVSLQMAFETGSFSLSAIMAGWLGHVPLAAYQIIVITGTLGFCVYYSISSSVAVYVANYSGQSDAAGMRKAAFSGYRIMLCLIAISSCIFIFLGRYLMGAFSEDREVVDTAVALILPLVLYQLADGTQMNFAGALRGTGHVTPMLWIALLAYIIFGLPVTYVLGFVAHMGLYGIVLSFTPILMMAAVLYLYFFMRSTIIVE